MQAGARGENVVPKGGSKGPTQTAVPRRNGGLHVKKYIKQINSSKAPPGQPAWPVVDEGLGNLAIHSVYQLGLKTGPRLTSQPTTLLLNKRRSNNGSTLKTIF